MNDHHFSSVFSFRQIFAKVQPEKYDLDLYKGFFMEKMTQNDQILIFDFLIFFKSPDFMISSSM
jgi:hypothetical protein